MADVEPTKTCTKCKRVLPLSSFGERKRATDGRNSACKECESARTAAIAQARRDANPTGRQHKDRELDPDNLEFEPLPPDAADLIALNKTYGWLRPLGYLGRKYTKRGAWACRCDPNLGGCGKVIYVLTNSLTTGNTLSCGCYQKSRAGGDGTPNPAYRDHPDHKPQENPHKGSELIDITGEKYGMLTIIERAPSVKYGRTIHTMWACLCDCGKPATRNGAQIRRGAIISCGCLKNTQDPVRSEEVRRQAREYMKRRRSDPRFLIESRIRARMWGALKRVGASRTKRLGETLGYTIDQLEAHLQTTLPAGSTWDDLLLGKLEIDHVRELWRFPYVSEDCPGFKAAWALSNLQLLTKEEHAKKSAASERERPR